MKNKDRLEGPNFLTVLHWIACIFGALIVAFYLLQCYLTVSNALQDVRKYEITGSSRGFWHYLRENRPVETVCVLLLVIAELIHYIVQYRRAERYESFGVGIICLSVLLAIHVVLCLHANFLPLPETPPFTQAVEAVLSYRMHSNITLWPSAGYFVLYWLRSKI